MTKAETFAEFMQAIWADHMTVRNGITVMCANSLYDEWHNAKKTVLRDGARRTGATQINGEWYQVYSFDDGSRVAIRRDGGDISVRQSKLHQRPNRVA